MEEGVGRLYPHLVGILAVCGCLCPTVSQKVVLHDVFEVTLVFAHRAVHHCKGRGEEECHTQEAAADLQIIQRGGRGV